MKDYYFEGMMIICAMAGIVGIAVSGCDRSKNQPDPTPDIAGIRDQLTTVSNMIMLLNRNQHAMASIISNRTTAIQPIPAELLPREKTDHD